MKDRVLEIIEMCLDDAKELVKIADKSNDEYLKQRAYADLAKWEKELADYTNGGGK